jgi:hypothetical protein
MHGSPVFTDNSHALNGTRLTDLKTYILPTERISARPRPLLIAYVGYLALAISLSIFQRGYINSDFVAYATLAHRLLLHPAQSLASHWSPLFSWSMAPLIAVGVPDPLAARAVLIAAGALYVFANWRLVRTWLSGDTKALSVIGTGVMVCAVIEAAEWSSFLLDADLVAASLLFCYFAALSDFLRPKTGTAADFSSRPKIGTAADYFSPAIGAGVFGALAFLAKSYMLPFVIVHFPASMFLSYLLNRRESFERRLKAVGLFAIPLLVIAGSWIALLSIHYHRFVISSAGASDHAASSPEYLGKDILWHPGLVRDYIANPMFGPDWSPLASKRLFQYQLGIVHENLANLTGHVGIWFIYFLVAGFCWIVYRGLGRAPLLRKSESACVAWCLITSIIYPTGYLLLIIDRRYVSPVLGPLLCLTATILVWSICREALRPGRFLNRLNFVPPALVSGIIVLLFSGQDIFGIVRNATRHPQMHRLPAARVVADALGAPRSSAVRLAANDYHLGLMVAFSRDDVSDYLGAPRTLDSRTIWDELDAGHADAYLRWVDRDEAYTTPPNWHLEALIRDPPNKDR